MDAQQVVPMRLTLEDMGHRQPSTPLQTDNRTAQAILCGVCKQKRSKSNDINFHWIRYRIKQKQFKVTWGPEKLNFGDDSTKHHPVSYHKTMWPINLYVKGRIPSSLKGCIKFMAQDL